MIPLSSSIESSKNTWDILKANLHIILNFIRDTGTVTSVADPKTFFSDPHKFFSDTDSDTDSADIGIF
jgi:hypothetical protein